MKKFFHSNPHSELMLILQRFKSQNICFNNQNEKNCSACVKARRSPRMITVWHAQNTGSILDAKYFNCVININIM